MQKLTLAEKKNSCKFCEHADKRALRKGWPHCDESYEAHNGHCLNLKREKHRKEKLKAERG